MAYNGGTLVVFLVLNGDIITGHTNHCRDIIRRSWGTSRGVELGKSTNSIACGTDTKTPRDCRRWYSVMGICCGIYLNMNEYIYIYIYIRAYIYIYTCIYIYILCMYIYVYIYIYISGLLTKHSGDSTTTHWVWQIMGERGFMGYLTIPQLISLDDQLGYNKSIFHHTSNMGYTPAS